MDDKVKEQLSALVDGELPEAEFRLLLARLDRDPELCVLWERYQLAGEVLRNQAARFYDPGFARRVMEAIEREPAAGSARSPRRSPPGWLRTGASVALAAGVAVVAVLLLRPGDAVGPQERFAAAGAERLPAEAFRRLDESKLAAREPPSREVLENLSQYVVNHNEFATRAGLPHLARQVSVVESGRMEVK